MKTVINQFRSEYYKYMNTAMVFRGNVIHISEKTDYVLFLNKIRKYTMMKFTTLSSFMLSTLLFIFTFVNCKIELSEAFTPESTIQSMLAFSNLSLILLLVFGLLSNISLILFFVLKNRFRNFI